jgi:histone H3/H4
MHKTGFRLSEEVCANAKNSIDVPLFLLTLPANSGDYFGAPTTRKTQQQQGKDMNNLPSVNIEEILRESVDNYEKALRSGIKFQEDAINRWKDVLPKLGSPEELKAKLEEISAEVVPAARKQLEEAVGTLSRTSDQVLSLSEKTVSVYKAPTLEEAKSRLQDLTESYFAAARENLKIAFDANARVTGYWSDLVGRFVPVAK